MDSVAYMNSLEHFFHDIELLNVLELETQRLLANEAHCEKCEAVTCYIEGANLTGSAVGHFCFGRCLPKIGGNGRLYR